MKLSDFVPSKATLEGLQGVETELQSRRYAGNWSLAVAVFAAAFKIALLIRSDGSLSKALAGLRDAILHPPHVTFRDFLAALTTGQAIVFLVAFLGAGLWVTLRYTGVLFKQSQRPFRYTFSIENFTQVKGTPGARFAVDGLDQMNLLTNDLVERLKRRVQRFSLLEKAGADGTAPIAKGLNATSHFHIKAEYAVREDESGEWVMHIWPRVRIGAEGNAFTLANPVRLPFADGSDPNENETRGVLNLEEYQRLVERVYSSIATEIYKQIEIDLRDKMTLFPTLSLRALARYVEAEDFETSNTIDAYDRALEMYQTSLDELEASVPHRCRRFLRVRSALEAEAKTKLGYSRCKIYRRLASEMAARGRNPIYDSRGKLGEAIELLRQAYSSFFPIKRWSNLPLPVARDAVSWPLRRRRSYRRVRGELCEALAVDALAYSLLDDSAKADSLLRQATTLADIHADTASGSGCPDRVRLLLFLAQAELEPRLEERLTALSQALELSLDSEIALYRHAYYSDLLARDRDEITKERVKYLSDRYEEVLRANPANIASLIGQGYLYWLADELTEAHRKFLSGIELQKIVKQTFVGDLKYCLARVEVELVHRTISCSSPGEPPKTAKDRLNKSLLSLKKVVFPYEEAIVADQLVAASYTDQQSKARNSYFNRINRRILERYETFVARTRQIAAGARRCEEELGRIPDVLLSYALNDYGNACLNYYLRFEYSTGKVEALNRSLSALGEAVSLNRGQLMIQYNLFLAQTWKDSLTESLIQNLLGRIEELPVSARGAVLGWAIRREPGDFEAVKTDRAPFVRATATISYRSWLEGRIELLSREIDPLTEKRPSKKQEASLAMPVTVTTPALSKVGNPFSSTPNETSDDSPENRLSPPNPTSSRSFPGQPKRETALDLKEDERRQCIACLDRILRFDELEEPIRRYARNSTALAPYAGLLSCDRARDLVSAFRASRFKLEDDEVSVLASIAQVWQARPDPDGQEGSQRLCDFLLDEYRPDDFDLNLAAFQTAEAESRNRYVPYLARAVDQSLHADPQSCQVRNWALVLCTFEVETLQQQKKHPEAIKRVERVRPYCDDFPMFHDWLAFVYEEAEKANPAGSPGRTLPGNPILGERRKANELDPENTGYRDSALTALGRGLVSGRTFSDPLEGRSDLKLLEVEFSDKSASRLGLTGDGLSPGLQQKINDLRKLLEQNLGFTLPGVNFRDNIAVPTGEVRVLTRGVPSAPESVAGAGEEAERQLAKRLAAEAVSNAAQLFSAEDCYWKLKDPGNGGDIRESPRMLAALTWVLRALLMEGTSIADLDSIISAFRDCQSRGLGLIQTVEEIRSLPEVRKRLKGNSRAENAWIRTLPPDLDRRLEQAIDFGSAEPIFSGCPGLRQEVCSVAREATVSADGALVVMLTSAAVRPFVRKIVRPLDTTVLSYREIFPGLLSQLKEPNGAASKTLHAAAAN